MYWDNYSEDWVYSLSDILILGADWSVDRGRGRGRRERGKGRERDMLRLSWKAFYSTQSCIIVINTHTATFFLSSHSESFIQSPGMKTHQWSITISQNVVFYLLLSVIFAFVVLDLQLWKWLDCFLFEFLCTHNHLPKWG